MADVFGGLAWLVFLLFWFAFLGGLTYVIGRCIFELMVDSVLLLLRKQEKFDRRPLNRPPFHIWGPPGGSDGGN